MTIDETANKVGQDLSLKDTEPQQKKPFEVVLVDIKKAAEDNIIHCVKKPLDDDLKFVALSYRWGELHEVLVDTGVGYTASITSFHLDDFYQLCKMMTIESDTKHINYVWVDAICVDQTPSKRKATIHQMSNIYDRATYILAVPDLHVAYLKSVSFKNEDTIKGSTDYYMDLYHLLHGHASQLNALDKAFLDDAEVPTDPPALRQLLLQNTNHFAYGLMKYNRYSSLYCPVLALDHLCETATNQEPGQHLKTGTTGSSNNLNGELHQCDKKVCPLDRFLDKFPPPTFSESRQFHASLWKPKILQRSNSMRQSMEFLVALIKDWSTRVWVISEFNIAKKKNNLKYWFIQLSLNYGAPAAFDDMVDGEKFTFFPFDFNDLSDNVRDVGIHHYSSEVATRETRTYTSNPVYIQFHYTLNSQLSQKTFLQNILIAKASRNEDRFYSILPFSPYHDRKLEVSHWKIDTMTAVKLKLYEIMHTYDKLALLYLSGDEEAIYSGVLPTFATSTLTTSTSLLAQKINKPDVEFKNFDENDPSSIMLYHQTNNNNDDEEDDGVDSHPFYLRLKPKEYYVVKDNQYGTNEMQTITRLWPVLKRLGLDTDQEEDDASKRTFDIVSIPHTELEYMGNPGWEEPVPSSQQFLTLVGRFVSNKWIVSPSAIVDPEYGNHVICHGKDDDAKCPATSFDIY